MEELIPSAFGWELGGDGIVEWGWEGALFAVVK